MPPTVRAYLTLCGLGTPLTLAAVALGGEPEVSVRCALLAPAAASEFEARARAELAVRGETGSLTLSCPSALKLSYRLMNNIMNFKELPMDSSIEQLLGELDALLDAPRTEAPVRHLPERPEPPPVALDRVPQRPPIGAGVTGGSYLQNTSESTLFAALAASIDWRPWRRSGLVLELGVNGATQTNAGYRLYAAETSLEWRLGISDNWFAGVGLGAGYPLIDSPPEARELSERPWFPIVLSRWGFTTNASPRLYFGLQLRVLPRRVAVTQGEVSVAKLGHLQPGAFISVLWDMSR